MVSDIVLIKELPAEIKNSVAAYVSCVAGASTKGEYLSAIQDAGFQEIKVLEENSFPIAWMEDDPLIKKVSEKLKLSLEKTKELSQGIVSVKVSAHKPEV